MTYSRRQLEAFGEPFGESATRLKPGGRIYGGGGSPAPPAPGPHTVTQSTIPEYARPYVERMLGKTEALSQTPYQAYGGERIAGFTPMQQQAFQGVTNLQPAQQLGVGTQLAGLSGLQGLNAGQQYAQQATSPGSMQAYMSPFTNLALEPQLREAARRSALEGQTQQAQAVRAGAFGGSRQGLIEAERQRNLGQLQSDIYGRGMQTAFEQARQAQQFGADLGLRGAGLGVQAAGTLGQLGQTQFGQQKDVIQGQLSAGAQQQALEQQRLGQAYQDFQNQRQYPYQQLAFMSDMLRGLPLAQYSQTMYQPPPSMLGQVAGAGLTYLGAKQAGLFGAEGGVVPGGLAGIAADKLMQG
jgi:hypothetical protein